MYFPFRRAFLQHTCKCNYTYARNEKYGINCANFHETPKAPPVLSAYRNSYTEFNPNQGINAESRHRN